MKSVSLGTALLLAICLTAALAACGGGQEAKPTPTAPATVAPATMVPTTTVFDIDPDITGNTASSIGAGGIEDCVRVDGSGGFDDSADHTIDAVVQGDTQALMAYDAWITYDKTVVHVLDSGTDAMIKLPGASDMIIDEDPGPIKSSDGRLDVGAGYMRGGPGLAGDGTILRISLDINFDAGPAVITFGFAKGAYNSAGSGYLATTGTGLLAINEDCPAAPPATPTQSPTP